jgi:uncharacterized protein
MTSVISENLLEMILKQPNVIKTETYFRWCLINKDYDDNKFVDVAIASNADFIITNDKHFKILQNISFPNVQVLNLDEFKEHLF